MSSDLSGHHYVRIPPEPPMQRSRSARQPDDDWIFDELPRVSVVSVSGTDSADFSPVLLTYTLELHYKQFKWQLLKRPSQVFSLHFALKRRAIIEEFYEKQEQVKEWLQNLGIGEHAAEDEDEGDEDSIHLSYDEHSIGKSRNIPSRAALPIIRPSLGRQEADCDRAKLAMQGYLNHFLGNLDIANSREVCKFLEVSKLSFLPEYGPKMKEEYVLVKHLPQIKDDDAGCCTCDWLTIFNSNWQKVWAVLKPGFLALLQDPLKTKLLDIIVFETLPTTNGKEEVQASLARARKSRNPLWCEFEVSCGSRKINLRVRNSAKVRKWISTINDVVLRPPEGWCHPHRFGSFAPQRGLAQDDSMIQWFIDGHSAFSAIASSIEKAKSEIFLTGWWLCPDLYLRRPFVSHPSSRLDTLLETKAKEGIKIYVLMYKEVPLALKINSVYSKRRLVSLHENIQVLRYPDHLSTGVYLWSHHEKLVIVDHQICYLGGLDLCFGRYDTPEHTISDCPPTIWPGKDYYNPRESEPNSWEETMRDELDRTKYPRMPWHDVQCALWGPPCRDVARHFVQRWNHAKRSKAANEKAIPLLIPHQHMVIPHYMGRSNDMSRGDDKQYGDQKEEKVKSSAAGAASLQDIPLLLPRESDGQDIYGNNTLNSLSNISNLMKTPSTIGQSLTPSFRKLFENGSSIQINGYHNDLDKSNHKTEAESNQNLEEWWKTQVRGGQVSEDLVGQVGPRTSCSCQIVRSVGQWSAGTSQTEESIHNSYVSLIGKAEHFIYIENQFFISGLSGDDVIKNRVLEALYGRIMRAHREKKCFRVIVVIPLLPGFQGGLDDGGAASVRALLHWQLRTISNGSSSILKNLYERIGDKAHDYISFYGLRTYGRLNDGDLVATNQVYVHSKLMIIDDHISLIGSANINDRSLLGSRDSEIGIAIEDKDFVESLMNKTPWKAGKFASSLRLSLWSEHLGLRDEEINCVVDPIEDASYNGVWMKTAKANTAVYQDVFACIPNNSIPSRNALRHSMSTYKEKLGHTTIDLGIAPAKLETYQNGQSVTSDSLERLQSIKGNLVLFPLEFMCQEDLRPAFIETEFYATPQVFH